MKKRTLSEMLIEADRLTELEELTRISNELTDSNLSSEEKIFGLEHIIDLGNGIFNETKLKSVLNG